MRARPADGPNYGDALFLRARRKRCGRRGRATQLAPANLEGEALHNKTSLSEALGGTHTAPDTHAHLQMRIQHHSAFDPSRFQF